MLTRGRLASTMENFKPSFLAALEDEEIVERYKLIFEPMFKTLMLPVTSKLTDTVAMLSQSITSLKKEVEEKDSIIRELQGSVSRLQVTVDDLEQHGRRESMRVFGLPETTPGSTDDILNIFQRVTWYWDVEWKHPGNINKKTYIFQTKKNLQRMELDIWILVIWNNQWINNMQARKALDTHHRTLISLHHGCPLNNETQISILTKCLSEQ